MTFERAKEISKQNNPSTIALKDADKGWVVSYGGMFFKYGFRNNHKITNEKTINILKKRTDWKVLDIRGIDFHHYFDIEDIPEIADVEVVDDPTKCLGTN